MKLKYTVLLAMLLSTTCMASMEDGLCSHYFPGVARSYTNIQQQGNSLSSLAKRSLYNKMEGDLEGCLQNCAGDRFKYCNDVARKMEGKK